MKKLFLILLTTFITTAAGADVLIEFNKPLEIKNNKGKKMEPSSGLDLLAGSKIKVGKGGSATLMDDNGAIEELGENKSMTIGNPKDKNVAKKKTIISGVRLALKEATSSDSGPTVYGMVKMGKPTGEIIRPSDPPPLHGIHPVGLSIDGVQKISFSWAVDEDRKGMFIVIDDSGNKHILTKPVNFKSGTIAIGPAPFKQGNKYSWFLANKRNGAIKGMTKRYRFEILSDAKSAAIKSDMTKINGVIKSDDGKRLLLGQLYYSNMMMDKAIEQLLPLYRKQPNAYLKRLLLQAYYRQDKVKEADAL